MKISRLILLTWLVSFASARTLGQIPQMIQFQGRVAVDGVNFDGLGQFKFALVDGSGAQTFWSHDGSSRAGAEPKDPIVLPVSHGLYSVLLGNVTIENMTPLPATVFTNNDVRLRIWFSDGTHGFQRLTPDQRIGAVGYAMMSANVADGAITGPKLAPGAVTAQAITPGSITASRLAPDAAAENLRASGGFILSAEPDATNLVAAGFQKMGMVEADLGRWSLLSPELDLSGYYTRPEDFATFWTGDELLVWQSGPSASTGGRFHLRTGTWHIFSTNQAPRLWRRLRAAWTGKEMIVFSQRNFPNLVLMSYRPDQDRWTAVPTNGLQGSWLYTFDLIVSGDQLIALGPDAVWKFSPGEKRWIRGSAVGMPRGMGRSVVWAGEKIFLFTDLKTGSGAYDPQQDRWTPINRTNSPAASSNPLAIWTGKEAFVLGPEESNRRRYDPATDTWKPLAGPFGKAIWSDYTAVWAKDRLFISYNLRSSTAVHFLSYAPETDRWLTLTNLDAIAFAVPPHLQWTGSEALVFGFVERTSKSGG